MPNGNERNWVRLCASIDGFRKRHGVWPTRVRAQAICIGDLRGMFSPEDFDALCATIQLVVDEEASMVSEDEQGRTFDYGNEGFTPEPEEDPARLWLGVTPTIQPE
jgi:hypothetical protein